jgi:hypothetical protein
MAIKCTYRQLAALRDQSERGGGVVPGPISKLNKVDESTVPSIGDRIRISRFVSTIITETIEYEQAYMVLVKKYRAPDEKNQGQYIIPPASQSDYQNELNKLEDTETEVATGLLPAVLIAKVPLCVADLTVLMPFLAIPSDSGDAIPFDKTPKRKPGS